MKDQHRSSTESATELAEIATISPYQTLSTSPSSDSAVEYDYPSLPSNTESDNYYNVRNGGRWKSLFRRPNLQLITSAKASVQSVAVASCHNLISVVISKVEVEWAYISLQEGLPSPLRELTYHMGSHSVTCHPAEVTFPPLPQQKLVLGLSTPEGFKAELTYAVGQRDGLPL